MLYTTLHYSETEWRYLKTLPIHHSQTLVEECPDGSKLISIHLKPSYDFIMDLLSRGPEVEVISPVRYNNSPLTSYYFNDFDVLFRTLAPI